MRGGARSKERGRRRRLRPSPAPAPTPAPAPVPAPAPPAPDASPPARDASLPARDATPAVADAAPAPPAPSAAVADDDSDDELLAFDSGFSVDTSNQACPLDESMAADAGYVPPPRALHAEPTASQGPELLARAPREADAARPMIVDDEDLVVAELEGATDDVDDHFSRAESAVLALLRDDRAFRDAGRADRDKAELVVVFLIRASIESGLDVRRRAADF